MISCDVSNNYPTSAQPLRLRPLVAIICLLSFWHVEAGSIYKTYDAQGNVVFTDQPVDEASAELMAPPEVNVSDPLPVAPQTPPQVPVNAAPTQLTDTATPLNPTSAVLPAAPDATSQTPVSAAQSSTPTAAPAAVAATDTLEVASPVEPAPAQNAATLPSDGKPEPGGAAVASAPEPTNIANDEVLSERVATPVLPEGARPPVIGTAKPSIETKVSISWPTDDEIVLSTQSPIWIELNSEPSSLKGSGLTVEIWIDDNLAVTGKRTLLPLVLPEIGMHKLQVRLVDGQGNSVAESDSQLMDVRLGATQNR